MSQVIVQVTEASPGRLGMFDPATGRLTELPVSSIEGSSPSLSELVDDQQGNIWFVDVGANMLGRYVPGKQAITFFKLSLAPTSPFALTLAPTGDLWFTAGNATVNYLGKMTP
jgi:streptogramin lyase